MSRCCRSLVTALHHMSSECWQILVDLDLLTNSTFPDPSPFFDKCSCFCLPKMKHEILFFTSLFLLTLAGDFEAITDLSFPNGRNCTEKLKSKYHGNISNATFYPHSHALRVTNSLLAYTNSLPDEIKRCRLYLYDLPPSSPSSTYPTPLASRLVELKRRHGNAPTSPPKSPPADILRRESTSETMVKSVDCPTSCDDVRVVLKFFRPPDQFPYICNDGLSLIRRRRRQQRR